MADNFRNKQWFKNMSQDRKDEICKKFDIDEKTLKKCGRETDDGRIVIDILRIDHINLIPKEWEDKYNALKNFKLSLNDVSLTDLEILQKFYEIFIPNVKFLKYKDNVHNNLLVKYTYKYTKDWYFNFIDPNASIDDKKFYAYQVWTQVKVLFESDLQLIKK